MCSLKKWVRNDSQTGSYELSIALSFKPKEICACLKLVLCPSAHSVLSVSSSTCLSPWYRLVSSVPPSSTSVTLCLFLSFHSTESLLVLVHRFIISLVRFQLHSNTSVFPLFLVAPLQAVRVGFVQHAGYGNSSWPRNAAASHPRISGWTEKGPAAAKLKLSCLW